jgi:hypothetical protein
MRKILFVAVPVMMAGLFALPGTAEAKKSGGGGLIGYGDILVEVGELPEVEGVTSALKKAPQFHGIQAGFKCKALVVLFAHIHKWNCKPVLVRDKNYWSADEQPSAELRAVFGKISSAIEKKYKPSDAKNNAWVKHGRIAIILGILGLIGYGVWSQMGKGKKKKDKKKDA